MPFINTCLEYRAIFACSDVDSENSVIADS